MVATYFTKGLGTKFQRSADNGSTYVDCLAVIDVQPAGRARTMMDASDLDDGTDEFAAGNITPGKIEVTARYHKDSAVAKLVHDDMDSDTPGYYRIYYSDTWVQPIRGLIENWQPQVINRQGDVQVKFTIQTTGAVPYPATAS